MDFSKFDNRGPAEDGVQVPLVDPITGEPIKGENGPACAIVRGVASRTVQAEMRKRALARSKVTQPKLDLMEEVHADLIESSLPLVVGFVNVERNGEPLTGSAEDIRWLLDLTFPIMQKADRTHVMQTGEKWVMVNRPFALQIAEAAGEQDRFLPSAARG